MLPSQDRRARLAKFMPLRVKIEFAGMSDQSMQHGQTDKDESWDLLIKSSQGSTVDISSVWKYRSLAWMFFKRDYTTLYKQTVLGPLWYIIQPTLISLTYYVVFGKIANLSTDGLPPFPFYMSGAIIWNFFSTCLVSNAETFSKNASIFGKVYFPRLVMPISVAMSGALVFVIQTLVLLTVSVSIILSGQEMAFDYRFVFFIPVLLIYIFLAGVGAGLIVSALTIRYRDLVYVVGFLAQIWMYGTPIVYAFSQIPENYRWIYYINPMTTPVQLFRQVMFGTPGIPLQLIAANSAIAIFIFVAGLKLFSRAEANAMDTV
nr:ABC transporter permease [Rhizobium sp. M10]